VTPNSKNGWPPAPRTGAKPVNGNGRAKGNADQGDLWSDTPAKPLAPASPPPEPVVEARSSAPSTTPAPPAPVIDEPLEGAGADAEIEVTDVEALDADALEVTDVEALDADALEDDDLELDDTAEPGDGATILAPPLNGRSTRASRASLPASQPEIDSRPNLLETVPAVAPFAEPDVFEDEYTEEEYEDEYGEGYYYRQDDMSLLRNPYVLAGLAVAMAIVLAVAVVFLFGRGGNDGGGNNGVTVQTPTVPAGGNGAVPGGLGVRSIATATVREGPDREYLEIGLLRADQDVQVVGRNQDSSWYQIVYPRDSQLRGWVPKSALSVPEAAAAALVVVTVTPIDRPTVAVPTATPRPAEPSATPDATETPNQRADIGVVIASDCAPNANISLQITNPGTVPISHNIQVIVSNDGSVEYDQVFEATIAPGQAASLNTGVRAEAPSMTATVILQGLADVNAGNNVASCAVSGSPGGGGNSGGGNNNGGGTNVPPPVATPRN